MTKCFTMSEHTEDLGYMIWRVSRFWQRGKHKMLDEFGLTSPQLEILGAIYCMTLEGVQISQIQLSQETYIDPMTTSTILRNLEKKGLISRTESKIDTRARVVELTEQGTELFEKAITKVKSIQDKLFENIDKEALKAQLRILIETLDKLKCANY